MRTLIWNRVRAPLALRPSLEDSYDRATSPQEKALGEILGLYDAEYENLVLRGRERD